MSSKSSRTSIACVLRKAIWRSTCNCKIAKGLCCKATRVIAKRGLTLATPRTITASRGWKQSGTVRVGDAAYQVNGSSWMDHEWSTSYLTGNQVGWDWFALQLDDGSELMMFQIRKADGSIDPFASGTLVAPDGTTRRLSRDDFQITVGATWRSPRSGATYPAAWTIKVPSADLTLDIKPYLADQELNVSFTYWEGAVQIRGERAGRAVSGSGYIEMTGYAGSMGGQF